MHKITLSLCPLAVLLFAAGCAESSQQSTTAAEPTPVAAQPTSTVVAEPTVAPEAETPPGDAIGADALGTYQIDPVHSTVIFRGTHFGVSYLYGRFNRVTGTVELKEDPTESTVRIEIATDSLYTANQDRDRHLNSPDFFNSAQFGKITFESASVRHAGGSRYEVTGPLSLHGVTKTVTVSMEFVGAGTIPVDQSFRAGFHGTVSVQRSEYGMSGMLGGIADEVPLIIAIEGIRQ